MRDEEFYGIAALEIAEQRFSQPLMAKAYAHAVGDPEKTKALYVLMRAAQLKEEGAIRHIEEVAARRTQELKRTVEEAQKKQDAAAERRKREEIEAQLAADNWNRSEPDGYIWESPNTKKSEETPKADRPTPSMSPEELEKAIESLKKVQGEKRSFL